MEAKKQVTGGTKMTGAVHSQIGVDPKGGIFKEVGAGGPPGVAVTGYNVIKIIDTDKTQKCNK
ncbi:MAG: hypothetical protein A3I43_04055 [Omnitrophica WOR_2 bacterium RIFCSPLOWO2_02_FULL_50_19]|nr:MAG: hypothetical protein A3I43_04055 [Omnitrophica WOR_2 bacterium RIFCSPLOWO2_02_FULL_50_19]